MIKPQHLIVATTWALCTSAWADAPLVSETADAIEAGHCQIEAAHSRQRASGQPGLRASDALFSCGVAASTQAALGYTRSRADGASAQAVRVFGKTNLVRVEDGRAGWGVRYGVEALKQTGASWRSETFEVMGLYSREIAHDILLHANLGHGRSRTAKQGTTLWSLGVETTGTFFTAADVFGDDRSRPWVSGGVGYSFGGGFSANASLAMQFDKPRVRSLTLGAKLEF
jgi:hypothetical protein